MQRPVLLSLIFALVMAFFSPVPAVHAQDGSEKLLAAYHDKNRVLLVFAPTAQDPAYLEQLKLWQGEKAGFEERQLVVLPVLADARKPAADATGALAKKFGVDARGFLVVLIGKDGHDAYRSAKPVAGSVLYGVIDAMPMRRTEMKRASPAPAPPATATPRPTPAKPDVDHDE